MTNNDDKKNPNAVGDSKKDIKRKAAIEEERKDEEKVEEEKDAEEKEAEEDNDAEDEYRNPILS